MVDTPWSLYPADRFCDLFSWHKNRKHKRNWAYGMEIGIDEADERPTIS
jgi:hypothetical protein